MIPIRAKSRDGYSREIRFEFWDRTRRVTPRSGGVYDLPRSDQERLLLPGHLPMWGDFLPDFAIIYATGSPAPSPDPTDVIVWEDIHVHVGGVQWTALCAPDAAAFAMEALASCEWRHARELVEGRYDQAPAPRLAT